MSEPRPNIFCSFKIVRKGRVTQCAIWNGIKDYENHPDKLVLAAYGNVVIVQIGRPVGGDTGRSVHKVGNFITEAHPADFVIFWARDDDTYQSCKNELRLRADISIDPDVNGTETETRM